MSAKLRLTAWFTLMMLLLAAMALVFILILNGHAVTDDPVERLVDVVADNAGELEWERGEPEWDELDFYDHGVYCVVYDADGRLLRGAVPQGAASSLPLQEGAVRQETLEGEDYYVFDLLAEGPVWIRGMISTQDQSGVMHTILILTSILLPALLLTTVAGGWFIAWLSFRPMERILSAAASISSGDDLSARIGLRRGPREMRQLSQAFDAMFARLEKSFLAEKQFASDASHELRTPVTVILAECARARRKNQSREDFLQSLDLVEKQGRRMSQLIDQLMSLTRMQQGTDRYPLRRGDLSAFVSACCEEFVPQRGIRLEASVQPGLEAEYNPSLLSRALENLFQNACKYGRENGRIWVGLERAGRELILSVRDDGIGIAPEDQERIWQRFWQADASREADGGAGLGLAMVREIAQLHQGRAWVESVPGQGSTFCLALPAL